MAVKLTTQVLAYEPDRNRVVALQLWSGFLRGRHGFVMVVNGTATYESGAASVMRQRFTAAGSVLAGTVVDDQTAREHLLAITGQDAERCTAEACGAVLPIGGLWCAGCGRAYGAKIA